MCNVLSTEEWNELQRYRIFKYNNETIGWPLHEYNDIKSYSKYIEKVRNELDIDSNQAAASILIKRLSFLFIGYLYMLSVHNKRLSIKAQNTFLVDKHLNKMWMPDFHLKDLSFECIANDHRKESFQLSLNMFFQDVFYPLIEKTYRLTKLSKWIMWENIAVYVYWLYDDLQANNKLAHLSDRINGDFKTILHAQGETFGKINQNPFKKMHNKKVYVEEYKKEIRPRTTCCFSYLMNDTSQDFCSTCPKKSCFNNHQMNKTLNGYC